MTSSTTRAFMAKKQSTSFAQVATNLLNVLQGYSKTIRLLLVMFVTLSVSANVWGAEYELVSFSDIKTNDVIIIVGTKSGTAYAMTNDGGTSNPPKPSEVTISNNKITTTATDIIFTATKNDDGTLTFANGTDKLYCTATNNGVRVGTNTNNKFSFDTDVDRLKNEATTRWLGIYNTQDWRCYTSASATNISGTTTTFYRKVTAAPSHTITATSNNNSYGTVSVSGTTITATPNDGYRVKSGDAGYTVTNGTAVVTNNGDDTFTVTPSSNCTITINFEAIPKYTVTWNVNGNQSVTTQVTEGSKPTFPATPSSCDATSTTFYGWATATWNGKIDDINGKTIYTSANEMPAVNGAVTYYAVFAEATTTGGGDEEKEFSFNITTADFNTTSYAANNNEKTSTAEASDGSTMEVKWTSYQVMQQSSTIQWQKNNGYIYNSTDLGTITSIDISSTDGTFTTYYGTSEQPSSSTTVGNGYFQIKIGNATGKSSNIEVTFTQTVAGGGGSTTYDNYITTCAAGDPCDALQAPNVTATATANSITLSWEAVAGATSYNVYNYTTDEAEEVNVLTYTFNGLNPETEYEWGVESAKGECFKETRGKTTTSATPCEQLGAATGLTVVTDFVQDGQTYVKFSWTPADNTKNYATSQKICFGKVDEAGTCVDDLAKNQTWIGDLKSKLEPGEYWWSIQALGDGVNYCDGDVVNGTNFTIEAPTYTVEWFVNGEAAKGTPTTSVIAGQKVTVLPTTPTSADCDDNKVFVGWTDTEINGTSANAPTNLYKELGDFPAINANTIYYAVFATPGEGGDDIPLISFLGGGQSDLLAIDGISASGLGSDYAEGNAPYRVKLDDTDDYILYTNSSGSKITKLYIKVKMIGGGNTSKITVQTSDNNSDDYADIDEWSIEGGQNSVKDVLLTVNSSSKYIRLYFDKGSNVGLGNLIFYTSSISYSDYSTTCVKLPDPVLTFATEPANPIVFTDAVCGGNSSKQSVTVVGENLRDVVNVSVTGPYKIARTVSTYLKDFTTSLTLDKTAGGAIHDNYKTVYIISTPPAQSTDATTGTLTFTTTKGNTLTVNLSTPTVTCTQYTLTLVDRGVSTEQPTKYYSGETIDEAPADPEGVCTDPIHYVFDGWAEATVAAGATTYTKVTFPYTVTGNTKFYAVYRYVEEGSGDSGDYVKVTENLDDYSGDYLIVYETGSVAFDGGLDELDETSNTIAVTISSNTIASNATTDAAKFTIAKVDGGYSIQSASGYYIGWSTADKNGLNANSKYSANYYLNTISNSIISGVKGTLKYNKTSGQERFRYYQSGQEAIALYRKAASYLYTTSPVCGPHLAITEGKDIYVTGGNAGGIRDLVIAQQKVSYKATRLQTSNSLVDGTAPDVKVATNGITVGGVVTSDVKVTIDQTKEQQTDGTYTITGTITVQYQPSANNKQEDIQVQLAVDYNAKASDNFTVHARSLPSEFVIVAKSGEKWYALNGDMNTNAANPANGQVTLDNDANPTKATYAPCNTIYTFDGLPNTGDRTYVRFQGTDGAWLWASSGTNVGIQNNVLKTTPEGNNNAYNWKLYTEDNITYRFGNANSNRQLTLSDEKFGMYASGVQDIRILPYDAKCLYNYAPSNLKVSVLKGTYVTLTWDAVIGATKYQYSTDATSWTDAGTEPTVTINDLTGAKEYTYYIRAYHEDTDVSQECIDYAEITFTTADCDDVPSDITYTADLNSITVSWTAAASTATIKLYLDENGEHAIFTQNGTTSPWKISTLSKNTTYYLQIFSGGTCASPIIPVKTEDVEVDIVEWDPQGIIVDINTDETIGVTLENEVSYGSGLGTEATELFFSKYYEASYNVKLVAIYNGTKNIIDLTDYIIKYGKTSWEKNYITLKDFGATKGQIQPGEEIILYSMQDNSEDDDIMDCVHEDFPDGNWVRVTSNNNTGKGIVAFAGDKTLALFKGENIIDIIGAVNGSIPNNSKANEKPSWGDANGWICDEGLSLADDSEIGISTNRCLLVRNNTVTSGANAVASNTTDFVTLCSEWKGAHVLDSDDDNGIQESCENFAYVGTFDYSDYYTKYESMGEGTTFDENDRNPDGTVTIPITDLYKHACSNIRVKLTNSNGDVLTDREYKVPIMITTTQGTDGEAFIALQQNLATKEVNGDGDVIATYPLSLAEVREICKTCDVVVRDNAILTKAADDAANDHPEVHDIYVYENSSLIVPNGTNYTINNLSLRRKQDAVASVSAYPDALKLPESAAAPISLDFRLSAESWHWFTLPYNCNISEVTWVDGSPAQYNVDWFLMTYDGEKRAATQAGGCWKAYTGTTIRAGEGFILAINGNINNPAHTYELRFPMSKEVLAAEGIDKTVDVRAWGVETNIRPNHKGWNLVGNPYLAYYQRNNITNFEGLRLGQLTGPDPQTGYWEQTGDVPYVVVPIGAGWEAYEQLLASETDLLPFTAYFVQVGKDGTHNSTQDLKVAFDHSKLQLSATPMPASIIQRSASVVEEPVIVGVSLTNAKGESDKTSLVIDNQFTDEYEMNADFFKWFGDYYKYYTKPVVYSLGADNGKRAFNALSEDLATQPISLGMYAAQAGNYTFTLDRRSDLSKVQEVWLYDATQDKYTNLMQDSYTFNTAKTESAGRFFLSVKMAPKVSTDINNVTDGTIWATTQDHTIFVNGLLSNDQLWIYDATGKLLHTDQTQYYQHTYQVPVSGTYFVRVQNTMQTQTIKVVVE